MDSVLVSNVLCNAQPEPASAAPDAAVTAAVEAAVEGLRPALERIVIADAADGLHQRVEAAPLPPGADVAEGAQREAHDARPHFGKLLDAEAAGGERAGSVALGEDVSEAQASAYRLVADVDWEDMYCRKDIGYRAVAREKAGR